MELPAEPLPEPAVLPAECLYIYGIVDRFTQPAALLDASRGTGLQMSGVGAVAAIHSWIDPSELDDVADGIAEGSRLAALVRHHDDVLKALAAAGAVLPVRLGTLLPDRSALTRMLSARESEIVEALDRVRDRSEWDFRVIVRQPERREPDTVAALATTSAGPGAGTRYLLHRRESRRRAEQARDAVRDAVAKLDEALSGLADDVAGAGTGCGPHAARAYLVHRSVVAEFLAAAEDGIAELERLDCQPVLRGPHPPYSFVDVRLEVNGDG